MYGYGQDLLPACAKQFCLYEKGFTRRKERGGNEG